MKRSRKGTRLNELQYFRQPLPHARKKMTCLRIFPSENASPTSKSRLGPASKKRKKRSGNPPAKLDINQPSIEMAVITYTDSQASLLLQTRRTHETQVSELDFPDILAPPRRDVSSFTQTDRPREKEAATSPAPILQEEVEEMEEEDQQQRSPPVPQENKSRRQSAAWLKRIFADFFQLLSPANKRVDNSTAASEPKPLKRDSYQRSTGLASLFRSRTDEEAALTQRILIKGDESLRAAYMNNVALKSGGRLHAQMSCGPLKSF